MLSRFLNLTIKIEQVSLATLHVRQVAVKGEHSGVRSAETVG